MSISKVYIQTQSRRNRVRKETSTIIELPPMDKVVVTSESLVRILLRRLVHPYNPGAEPETDRTIPLSIHMLACAGGQSGGTAETGCKEY